MNLSAAILTGDRLALARLLSQVENQTAAGRLALDELFPHAGKAHRIGITGAPGTGKSSLANQLARFYRHPPDHANPYRVAIVAVDPTSPFTGGAILGDRVRMRDLAGDPGVFIRSMASRGSLGGIAAATSAVVQVFDAAGYDIVLIETVGVGQAEVDVARLAHTILVVESPGLGDDIQAIKAGILEIADVLVINKADQPGAEIAERTLKNTIELAHPGGQEPYWQPPVVCTVATESRGISELIAEISRHRNYLRETGRWHERERQFLITEFEAILHTQLVSRWRAGILDAAYQNVLTELVERRISPYQAVERLIP
jgi:LAO/AO transport system kinase